MRLGGAALTTSTADQQLYRPRPVDDRLERLLDEQDVTVLLLVERGAGATSLLNRLDERIRGKTVVVNAAQTSSAHELLERLSTTLSPAAIFESPIAEGAYSDEGMVHRLGRAVGRAAGRTTMLLDGPVDPGVAFDLFGRQRDALRALGVNWVVTGFDLRAGDYLTPPADVFYDYVVDLPPFAPEEAVSLLRARGLSATLAAEAVSTQRELSTQPRAMIQRARGLVAGDTGSLTVVPGDLTAAERQLLEDIVSRGGPVIATDPDLRRRLGVTERTVRRSLATLEERGLLRRITPGASGPRTPGDHLRAGMSVTLRDLDRSRAFSSTREFREAARFYVWHSRLVTSGTEEVDHSVMTALESGRSSAISGLPGSGKSSTFAAVLAGADGAALSRIPLKLSITSTDLRDAPGDVRPFAARLMRMAARIAEDPDAVEDAAAVTGTIYPRRSKQQIGSAPKLGWQKEIAQRTRDLDLTRGPDELLESLAAVVNALVDAGKRPVLLLDDADGLLRVPGVDASAGRELADRFFAEALAPLLRAAGAPALMAVQPEYLELPGFERVRASFGDPMPLPLLSDFTADGVLHLVAHAISAGTGVVTPEQLIEEAALQLLADSRFSIQPRTVRALIDTLGRALVQARSSDHARITAEDVAYALTQA